MKTGYVPRFLVYTGDSVSLAKRKELGYAGSVVADLLADLLGKGQTLWTISTQAQCTLNFYTATTLTHAELCV